MEIKGTIYRIDNERQVSDKFKLREFIVTTDDQYPQSILLQTTQDKCNLLDKFKKGDTVTAHINIRGRLITDKTGVERCWNSIEVWRIEGVNAAPQNNQGLAGNNNDAPF
jgi:hypothetical protein